LGQLLWEALLGGLVNGVGCSGEGLEIRKWYGVEGRGVLAKAEMEKRFPSTRGLRMESSFAWISSFDNSYLRRCLVTGVNARNGYHSS
jgi:hypothetical protein